MDDIISQLIQQVEKLSEASQQHDTQLQSINSFCQSLHTNLTNFPPVPEQEFKKLQLTVESLPKQSDVENLRQQTIDLRTELFERIASHNPAAAETETLKRQVQQLESVLKNVQLRQDQTECQEAQQLKEVLARKNEEHDRTSKLLTENFSHEILSLRAS